MLDHDTNYLLLRQLVLAQQSCFCTTTTDTVGGGFHLGWVPTVLVENEGQQRAGEATRNELEVLGTMDTTMIDLMYRKDVHDLEIERKIMILPDLDLTHVISRLMTLPETRPTLGQSSNSSTINVAFTLILKLAEQSRCVFEQIYRTIMSLQVRIDKA